MPLLDIFRKDRKQWTQEEIQEVDLYFQLSPFFSPYYQHSDFEELLRIIFYSKVNPDHELDLSLNRKSDAMVVLAGHVQWFRLAQARELKKQKKGERDSFAENYVKMGECMCAPELVELKNDVIIRSKSECSEILFIPTLLRQAYIARIKQRRIATIMEVLFSLFKDINKYQLLELAEKDCKFRELRMNNYIYRAGDKPEHCYAVIAGNVKLDSPSYQHKKMQQMAIIGPNSLFGHQLHGAIARNQNAACCSAYCKLLEISLQSYYRLVMRNQHLNPILAEQLKEKGKSKGEKSQSQSHSLPRIQRFHSFVKSAEEQKIEKNLVQNCHMLISLSPRKKNSLSFRLPEHVDKDYSINQFQQKLKLFRRRQKPGDSFDLTNKLI